MAARPQTFRPVSWPLSWMRNWHRDFVFERRTPVLGGMLAAQIPQGASVLDIGCGDFPIAGLIFQGRQDITIQGVEFLVPQESKIEFRVFDGSSLPFQDASFD